MTSKALKAFKAMIQTREFVVLDTETTGLRRGEIVEIAIVNSRGETLLNKRVKPQNSIPDDAIAVHGITPDDVQDCDEWRVVAPTVKQILLRSKNVVVYNAVYDREMMHQSGEACRIAKDDWKTFSTWWCAMEAFAEVYGDWNDYHKNYRWQKLTTVADYYDIPVT